ncbi:hypothetical protein H696_02092 [Fonticula alba]|uniref:PDZ domain-containing protein n=1 Tax=Fonticula alba TaxID=691883 RepID=A0A058ZCI0_FONAL|nr:hypothetical protein H696_02092 [Fonticula alba]KCV71142.1 hypothetical protein H696_02092 [Fonticula alba]|eukprot:XP_009494265.1 hypothetical protein H696_02092 [Fonticula alba]
MSGYYPDSHEADIWATTTATAAPPYNPATDPNISTSAFDPYAADFNPWLGTEQARPASSVYGHDDLSPFDAYPAQPPPAAPVPTSAASPAPVADPGTPYFLTVGAAPVSPIAEPGYPAQPAPQQHLFMAGTARSPGPEVPVEPTPAAASGLTMDMVLAGHHGGKPLEIDEEGSPLGETTQHLIAINRSTKTSRLGMEVRATKRKGALVLKVSSGGMAALSGIQKLDRIIQIDGQSIVGWDHARVTSTLRAGKFEELLVERCRIEDVAVAPAPFYAKGQKPPKKK